MNAYPFIRLKLRSLLIFFCGVIIVVALFFGNDYQLSWAAPEQNPHMQTVPPRPTATPSPTSPPSLSNPPPTQEPATDPEDKDNDNEEEDEEVPAPTRTRVEDPVQDEDELIEPADNDEDTPANVNNPDNATTGQDKPSAPTSDQEDKGDQVLATPQQADLSLISWVDNSIPKPGETITITTIISNSGPSRVTNVIVRESLPPGMILSSALASRGVYEADKGLWTISTIGRSKQVTMSISMRVAETEPVTVTAEVMAADQSDPDSTPHNDLETEDDQDSVALTPRAETSLAAQNQSDLIDLRTTSPSPQETLTLSNEAGWLYWLYALIIGIALVFMGAQLVHRS